MTADELMQELKKADIRLSVVEDDLVIRGKKQSLNAELLIQIREHKLALLDLLKKDEGPAPEEDIRQPHTPEAPPLVSLTPAEIETIRNSVPGGEANVQDIYPLAPLQEGILFHHILSDEGDAYLTLFLFSFDNRARLDKYVAALEAVVDRNDILRTAVVWEGLHEPMQVVWRKAPLHVEEIELDSAEGDAEEQMCARFDPRRHRIDVRQAPLLRLYLAHDPVKDRWLMLMLLHHLAGDRTTMEVMQAEIEAYLLGQQEQLPKPLPFRNLVAQSRHGISQQEHEAFFRQMLGDVEEPTTPFGLLDVRGDGSGIEEAQLILDDNLARRLRANARRLGISVASLCHLAWAQVLAKSTGRRNVVFGTVLFGRMASGEGADRVMGLFINTLPVQITIGEEGAAASARRTQVLLAELMRHEHASLALAQRCSAVPAEAPLFSSILNYRYTRAKTSSEESMRAWEGIQSLRTEERTNYPMMLSVNDLGSGFSLDVQTLAAVGPMRVCEFMRTALASLVEALELSPSTATRAIEVLSSAERRQVLYDWNETGADYPRGVSLSELVEAQVERTPGAVAVAYGEKRLTYRELNERANRLAHELRKHGAGPDEPVGLFVERSTDLVVSLLAIVKSGAAYLPLDPLFPAERLGYMLEDSEARLLITQQSLRGDLPRYAGTIIQLEDREWQTNPVETPAISVGPEDLAYVIYTSGSTGKPKGVQVPRGALTNFLWSMRAWLQLNERDRLLAVTTISFDIAGLEIWLPLLVGAQIVVASHESAADGSALRELLERHDITFLQATPVTWRLLFGAGWAGKPDLQAVCGGEAMPPEVAEQLAPAVKRLWNLYGPTETTIWSTGFEVTDGTKPILIGRPVANTQCYILDEQREPVPIGVIGELYIGGDGLARGYLNRPELTAEKFVADPFRGGAARMYRTGDLARYLPDGMIECLGRVDHQVKIRGYRIELSEIEALLKNEPEIKQAVVIVREDTPGDKRLVAYYTASRNGESDQDMVSAEQFRAHLSKSLPEYMVPAAYVRLDAMPLTPNGKLDRKALPAPESGSYSTRDYEPPQGEMEMKLAAIWAEVLKLDRVGRHDNFFDLGGHSLLAVQLILRLEKLVPGEPLPLRAVLEAPTVERFAVWLENRGGNKQQILVQVRPGSDKRKPFFCVHGAGGNVLSLRPLAMALSEDLPVYFLQAKGLDGSEPFQSVEETAQCYVNEIRKVQPHGPYQLGGMSYGSLVAFEMARLLEQLGEPVSALILIDSVNPAFARFLPKWERMTRVVGFSIRRAIVHSRKLLSLRPNEWFSYTRGPLLAAKKHLRSFAGMEPKFDESAIPFDADWEKMKSAAGTRIGEILERVGRASRIAGMKFIPKPYGGGAVIVRSEETIPSPYDDRFMGWRPVVKGEIEIFKAEGTHESIFKDPAVRPIALRIDTKLRESSAKAGSSHSVLGGAFSSRA